MNILVTGGSGYIGSFTVKALLDRGDNVTIIDNLKRGHKDRVDKRANLVEGDLTDSIFLRDFFSSQKFDAVIHFAAYISMGESMQDPYLYFYNNVTGSLNLIENLNKSGINKIVFSSSAGVYGNPIETPINEDHPKNPTNPYGESKLMVEKILSWYYDIFKLNSVSLRYFNACGGSLDGSMGEAHEPETHIIPNAIKASLKSQEFTLFGTDYDTPDGTCVRDYIHVLDLAQAHLLALDKMTNDSGVFIYNVGTGQGHSNKEILEEVKKVTGMDLKIKTEERRPGDANILVADSSKIKQDLGFTPQYSDLSTIIKTAWLWHKNTP